VIRKPSRPIGRALVPIVALVVALSPSPLSGAAVGGLTSEEEALLASLDVGGTIERLEHISGLGEKVAGTEEELQAQRFVYDTLSAMPLDEVVMEGFPTTSWSHDGDRLRVVSPVRWVFPTSVYGYDKAIWGRWFGERYSLGNRDHGKTLRAQLVDVGYGTAADFDAAGDVEGKIVLARRDDDVQGWFSTVGEEAALRGAAVVVNYGYYGDVVARDGIKQDVGGVPIPEFAISVKAAERLLGLLADGRVTLELEGRADAVSEEVGESVNVAAYLYGATHPDEYIVISGHIDCWWTGASDNSSSIAAMLELARVFSEAREAGTFVNDRTIVFVSFAAEEFGGPAETWYDWLIGSYEYVTAHPEVMDGLVVDLNMDGVSFKPESGKYWLENTWEVNGFIDEAIDDLGLSKQVSYYNPTYSWTDAWALSAKAGGSAIQGFWTGGYDAVYHTQLDNMKLVSRQPVRFVLRLYALMAARASGALVLPFDFLATTDWAGVYLGSERDSVAVLPRSFGRADRALGRLIAAAEAANARAEDIATRYVGAETEEERTAIRAEADALNRAMIDVRRIVTPWTLGEGGTMGSWDVFLRSDQHVHDLVHVQEAIDALSDRGGRIPAALRALRRVYSMEWGQLFSPKTYRAISDGMIGEEMYWGDDFDQQQGYVDVHGIHLGLSDGTLSGTVALQQLREIRRTQLLPWLAEDLDALEAAWLEAAATL
jgi:hypothetical protein